MAAGSAGEVFATFLKLGLTSFGGPIAHIGYFHRELVEKRQWLSESQFAQLLALCQFLPGPASSQLGFALGLTRAGWAGAIAAFVAFTLPSALLLFAFAAALPLLQGDVGSAAIHGLKLVAVAVVAHGVIGMSRQLCPDAVRATIACGAAVMILLSGSAWMQLAAVAGGALAGLLLCRSVDTIESGTITVPHGTRAGTILLALFFGLLLLLPLLPSEGYNRLIDAFYRAGALVFGGGHVVLPLLESATVGRGWLDEGTFLAGYGAAQAVPGPMFSFAAYLGAEIGPHAVAASVIALLAIFLPGFLLLGGILPWWQRLSQGHSAASIVAGVNVAVVGLLGAALYDPVFTSAIWNTKDLAIALVGFTLLMAWKVSPLWVVLWCVGASSGVVLLGN